MEQSETPKTENASASMSVKSEYYYVPLNLFISILLKDRWTYYDDNTNDDNTKKVCQQEYEELKEWVPVCQRTCKALYAPLCAALIHEPSCVCVNGTVRDTDSGKCVLPQNCPQQQIINNN